MWNFCSGEVLLIPFNTWKSCDLVMKMFFPLNVHHFPPFKTPTSWASSIWRKTGQYMKCVSKSALRLWHQVDYSPSEVSTLLAFPRYSWCFRNPANQLRFVVYPIIHKVSKTSQVVVWDFWTIKRCMSPKGWGYSTVWYGLGWSPSRSHQQDHDIFRIWDLY